MAEELFDSRVASNMTLGEAVVRGILPAPKYVTTVYQYQKTLAKYQARVDNLRAPGIQDVNQKYLDALRRALEQADGLDRVFAHHITNKCGKYIVFCANKEHMDEMVSHVPEWFAGVNPDVVVYEAYSDDPNTDKAFADFKTDTSNRLKLLFCIDMLNEGVHVEGISGVILFRPTISPIIYKQQIGRALTAGNTEAPMILDVVNNFEGLTSISGLQSEMQEAVHRLYANGEGDKIVTERFEVIEQVHDCRVLFEQLSESFLQLGALFLRSKHLLRGARRPEYPQTLHDPGGTESGNMADYAASGARGTDTRSTDPAADPTVGRYRYGLGQPERNCMAARAGIRPKVL